MKRCIWIAVALVALTGCVSNKEQTDALCTQEAYMDHFPYKSGDIHVEKYQTITAVAEYPGLNVVETYYVNQGKPLMVTGYEMQKHDVYTEDTILWSLQPSSTSGRLDWVLPVQPGFQKRNYLGMNNTDYGGGIPVLDIWSAKGGYAIGLIEPVLKTVSMPVEWKRYDDHVSMMLRNDYKEPLVFATGDTLRTYRSFIYQHTGDYFNALRTWSEYMCKTFNIKMQPSENEAFEPVWCAWGYMRTFTADEVIGTLDKVQELGFKWVDVDDGFQIAEGDWMTNSRFPGGDKDMRRITDEIHRRGMKAKLWWAPLAADPGTECLKNHPERMLVTEEWAPEYITWWDSYYLSPVNASTVQYSKDLVDHFFNVWGFDGLKIDGQHLNCCLPDYNEASHLDYPEQSQELMPTFFDSIYEKARSLNPNAVVQICPCGCAINYYLLPTFNQAVASDPTSSCQIRMKRKAYAAMAPQLAYYGDHIELSDNGDDFGTQIGIGAVIGTKFTYPKDNPDVKQSCLLTAEKEALIRHWMKIYKDKDLARGEYLNLYTWGYDYPEGHVIRQNGAMYYAFYADHFEGKIELRGLDASKEYAVTEYTTEEQRQYTVHGANPTIDVNFNRNYLIEVKEQ